MGVRRCRTVVDDARVVPLGDGKVREGHRGLPRRHILQVALACMAAVQSRCRCGRGEAQVPARMWRRPTLVG
jgi:hypothetical protein